MKTKLSILLFFFVISSNAQVKILFDATKAETANNADWIIDADQFNLGYNPNPHIGGNEANPQRFPTPDQSGITASTTQNYWKGALSAWAVDAVKQGYQVETLPYTGQITYGNSSNVQDLANYSIFVVCEPNILFTTAEKTALMQFVQNGGGLFMISDHNNSDRNNDNHDSPDIWNDFMQNNTVQNNPFGITFDYAYFTEATTNIPNIPTDPLLHGSYGAVTSVEFYGGTSMTINTSQNASVKGVVYRSAVSNTGTTGVMCAYATYGQGKVVALGDSSPADDGTGDTNDSLYDGWIVDANGNHERLIMNATIWLASTSLSVDAASIQNDFIVFEGQEKNQLHVRTNAVNTAKCKLVLYDLSGREIFESNLFDLNTTATVLDIPSLKGLVIYQLMNNNKVLKTGKIIL